MAVIAGPRAVIRFESIKKTVIITPVRRTIKLERVGMRGAQGFSAYEVWVRQPGNEGKTEEEYFEWIANSQIDAIQPYLDAAEAARDAAQVSATEAEASAVASDEARDESVSSMQAAAISATDATDARDVTLSARDVAVAAKDTAVLEADASAVSAAAALVSETAAKASEDASLASATSSYNSSVVSTEARDVAIIESNMATNAAIQSEAARDAALGYRDEAHTFRDEAEGFRDEAEDFRDEIIVGDFVKKADADLFYRHSDVLVPIADVNGLQAALDSKTTEGASDLRYRQLSVLVPLDDVAGLNTVLAGKADLAGATFTGKVTLPVTVGTTAGLNLVPGVAPTAPVNGDVWVNSGQGGRLELRRNGATVYMWDSVSLVAMTQALAEAGTSDAAAIISPLKLRQGANAAIAAASGAANGIAPLGADSKISTTYLPSSVLGAMKFQSAWNAATNTPAIPAAAEANRGWYYIVSADGTSNVGGITDWKLGDWVISNGTAWDKIDNTDQVTSVQGRQGAVVISKADVGLSNADNTSDLNKPISTLTQAALDGKQAAGSYSTTANPLFTGTVNITGAAGALKVYGAQTVNVQRWNWGASAEAETGANAGSNWSLYRYADNGAFLGTALTVMRASGDLYVTGASVFSGTANFAATTHSGTATFAVGLSVGNNIATGFYGDNTNIAIRAYATGGMYFQSAAGTANFGFWNAAGLTVYGALSVNGTITATGNYVTGASGGLFVTGQFHRLYFDPAGGTRLNFRSDHNAAVGINLGTTASALVGSLYSDGSGANIGFLHAGQNWRLRTASAYASIYSDAGTEYQLWGAHNFTPANKMDVTGGNFTGAVTSNSNFRALSTGGTGQFTAVNGTGYAGFYVDAANVYILKSATSMTTFDAQRPFHVNLATGAVNLDSTGTGGVSVGGNLTANGNIFGVGGIESRHSTSTGYGVRIRADPTNTQGALQFTDTAVTAEWAKVYCSGPGALRLSSTNVFVDGEFHCSSWMRSDTTGSGWYHTVHGGGIYMGDNTWIQTYGNKNFLCNQIIQCASWTVTSDERLKSDIRPLNETVDTGRLVDEANVKSFVKNGKLMWGIIAQEAQANDQTSILVSEGGEKLPGTDINALTVDGMGYVYALLEEMKALRKRVAELEAR